MEEVATRNQDASEDIFKGLGVEIELKDAESFLKIKETLTRMGVASRKDKKLYQSCHILHKRGRYAITHFKEMFVLDRKPAEISEDDLARRNTIANLLEEWGLITIVDPKKVETPVAPLSMVKVLPFKEKPEWQLCPKYSVGTRK